jgi:hypothetical protein
MSWTAPSGGCVRLGTGASYAVPPVLTYRRTPSTRRTARCGVLGQLEPSKNVDLARGARRSARGGHLSAETDWRSGRGCGVTPEVSLPYPGGPRAASTNRTALSTSPTMQTCLQGGSQRGRLAPRRHGRESPPTSNHRGRHREGVRPRVRSPTPSAAGGCRPSRRSKRQCRALCSSPCPGPACSRFPNR